MSVSNVVKRAIAVGALLCAAPAAVAQSVQAPTMDSATLRYRLGHTAAEDRRMPADVADLDSLWRAQDLAKLMPRLRSASDAALIGLDLNWEKARILEGGGFIMAYAYMYDLWRLGSATPRPAGDQLKQSAGMMFAYAFDLIELDGVKCSDPTAAGHRADQLMYQNLALVRFVARLPRTTRMLMGTISLDFEAATAPLRRSDAVLCGDGLAQTTAGLKAMGDRPLPEAPSAPGFVGRVFLVPTPPGYTPGFVAETVWRPKQDAIRAKLPGMLTKLLSVPADEKSTPVAPPQR